VDKNPVHYRVACCISVLHLLWPQARQRTSGNSDNPWLQDNRLWYMAGSNRPFGNVPGQPAHTGGIGGYMLDWMSLLPWLILGLIIFSPAIILIYLFLADFFEHRKYK